MIQNLYSLNLNRHSDKVVYSQILINAYQSLNYQLDLEFIKGLQLQ